MNQQKFKAYMEAAQDLGDPYSTGYQRGLRRHYHGEKYGDPGEHEKWIALDGERGDGYRDGFEGKPPAGMHSGIGNQNALAGDKPKESSFTGRCLTEEKAAWVKAAQKAGYKNLNAFLVAAANRMALDVLE